MSQTAICAETCAEIEAESGRTACRPDPPGGTQLWVGYGCAARSFDYHPITKPEKVQICNL